jgi:DNA-binding transcriptional regulator YhcF (GntR family)
MKAQERKCKADQAMDYVLDWMRSGELKVGDRLPPERELCLKLGISRLTLNKAMARLEDAALLSRSAGRGTHVAKLPANDAIAVICDMEHLAEPYHSPSAEKLIDCLVEASRKGAYVPHFLTGRGLTAKAFIDSLGMESSVWREIKGVVAMAWKDGFEERLAELGIPSVIIGSWDQGRHAVILDYAELGRLAAKEALEAGARRVAIVHNAEFTSARWNNPVKSFLDACSQAGASVETDLIPVSPLTPNAGFELSGIKGHDISACDALFITNDNVALGFARNKEFLEKQAPKLILTQASSGIFAESFPKSFRRISFDPARTAASAISLLRKVQSEGTEACACEKILVKPEIAS